MMSQTRLEVATIMAQLIEDNRTDYDVLVQGLHDALVLRARLDAEHDPFARPAAKLKGRPSEAEAQARNRSMNRVARYRVLAHALTEALLRMQRFDREYPS